VTPNRDELVTSRDQIHKRFPRATVVDLIRARDLLEPVFLQAIKGPVGRSGRATSISNPAVVAAAVAAAEIKSPRSMHAAIHFVAAYLIIPFVQYL
jgi:hypothetical protein